MREIIELSYEDIKLDLLNNFLTKVKSSAKLLNYEMPKCNSESKIDFVNPSGLYNVIKNSLGGTFYFNFSDFNINGIELQLIGIQIYKYSDKYDLNIDFDDRSIRTLPIIYLQNWAGLIAKELDTKLFFCGIEPASDEETRFFTGAILGPLKFNI